MPRRESHPTHSARGKVEGQGKGDAPTFSEDAQHRELADENAPFEADWFMEMEKGLETRNMAHLWDEIAKTWFVKVAMQSLKANALMLLKRRRDDLGSLPERAAQLIGPVGTMTEVDEATVREMITRLR